MTNFIKERLLLTVAIVVSSFIYASDGTGTPCFTCPEEANPIDMYVYVLMAVGVLFIAFFGKRLMKSKA